MKPYDIRRSELREESTGKILDAAVCLFGKKGYEKTSVKDIADKAEVSLALVFKYFESKENLLSAAYRFATDEAYPFPERDMILRERVEILIKQSIQLMKTKPDTFDFFMTLLYTSDLPKSYQATRREFFRRAPIYPSMETWQRQRELPEGDLFDYFIAFMRTVYTTLDFYRKMPQLRNGERINIKVLMSYIVGAIEEEMGT